VNLATFSPLNQTGKPVPLTDRFQVASGVLKDCGCTQWITEKSHYLNVESHLEPSKCPGPIQKALQFGKVGPLRSCSALTLENSEKRKFIHLRMFLGEGMDCPSGCIYSGSEFLYDVARAKVISQFPISSYLLQFDEKRNLKTVDWNNLLPGLVHRWFVERHQDLLKSGGESSIRPFCLPVPQKSKVYLAKDGDKYSWAADLPQKAQCSLQFWPKPQEDGIAIGFDISGTASEIPTKSQGFDFIDFKYLTIQETPGLNRAVLSMQGAVKNKNATEPKPIQLPFLTATVGPEKIVLKPQFLNPQNPETDVGTIFLFKNDQKFAELANFPFYNPKLWKDAGSQLIFVFSRRNVLYYDYKTGSGSLLFETKDNDISEILLSPANDMVLVSGSSGAFVYSKARDKILQVSTAANASLKWIDSKQFKVEDSKAQTFESVEKSLQAPSISIEEIDRNLGTEQSPFYLIVPGEMIVGDEGEIEPSFVAQYIRENCEKFNDPTIRAAIRKRTLAMLKQMDSAKVMNDTDQNPTPAQKKKILSERKRIRAELMEIVKKSCR
jgi:hypothetical protein